LSQVPKDLEDVVADILRRDAAEWPKLN
jgi:hypothetical protein